MPPGDTRTEPRLGRLPTIFLALVVPLVALVTVLVTLNVTDDSAGSASGGSARKAGAGTAIDIKSFQYSPNPIVVKAGASVTVTNRDGTVHTLTSDKDGTFDTGDLDGGASKTITIAAPGKYAYHCTIHNYMTGTIEAK
jgi:plastocyanin